MQEANPTGDAGASTLSRLESLLAASEDPREAPQAEPSAEPAAQEAPTVEPEGDAPGEDEGPQISLSDVARVLGVDESLLDVDDDGQAIIKTKIDGQEGAAKLSDFLKSYQLKGHVDNESRAVADQKKALQTEREQFQQAAAQQAQHLTQLSQLAQAELMQEFQSIDWNTLAQQDPAEYVAKQHQFQSRQARLTQLQQVAQQQASQHQQQVMAQQTEQAAKFLAEKIPGWQSGNDVDKQITSYAQTIGLGEGLGVAIRQMPVIGLLLHKAMQNDHLQQSKAAVEAKVRAAPKIVKPGQPQAVSRQEQEVRNLKSTIRQSGGKRGIAEFLLATGKV